VLAKQLSLDWLPLPVWPPSSCKFSASVNPCHWIFRVTESLLNELHTTLQNGREKGLIDV
jgi:hypothetical protein